MIIYIYMYLYIYVYLYCDFQFPAIPSRSLAGTPIVNAHGVICGPNVVLDIGSRGGCCTADSPWSGEKRKRLWCSAWWGNQPYWSESYWFVGISNHEAVIGFGEKPGFHLDRGCLPLWIQHW